MDVTDTLSERAADAIRGRLAYRRRRGEYPTSAKDLAEAVGMSQSGMSARLTGTTPIDLNELEGIAAALGVEVAELLPTPVQRGTIDRSPRAASQTSPVARPADLTAQHQPPHRPTVRPTRAAATTSSGRTRRPSWTHQPVTT